MACKRCDGEWMVSVPVDPRGGGPSGGNRQKIRRAVTSSSSRGHEIRDFLCIRNSPSLPLLRKTRRCSTMASHRLFRILCSLAFAAVLFSRHLASSLSSPCASCPLTRRCIWVTCLIICHNAPPFHISFQFTYIHAHTPRTCEWPLRFNSNTVVRE